MKFSKDVSSSRRKSRRNHFKAPSNVRRKLMSATLDREQREKYNVRSLPIRKDDEIKVVRGQFKGREGKVVAVYRRKWVIHVDRCTLERANGATPYVGVQPSNVVIVRPKIDSDRKALLERKNRAANSDKNKGKFTEADVDASMGQVD